MRARSSLSFVLCSLALACRRDAKIEPVAKESPKPLSSVSVTPSSSDAVESIPMVLIGAGQLVGGDRFGDHDASKPVGVAAFWLDTIETPVRLYVAAA